MTQKIAVAVIHGIGEANPSFDDKTSPNFTSGIAKKLRSQFAKLLGETEEETESKLAIEAVYWAPVLQDLEDELDARLEVKEKLSSFFGLRQFIFHSLADSVGYQITSATPPEDREIYDEVHKRFSKALARLARNDNAGPAAPLCIIAHSLGAVVASNYIWDLQHQSNRIPIGNTPLEKGETFTLFYTLGSQIPFWSLRHKGFGTPVSVPSPALTQHYQALKGEWINFYDRDDLLGYPIQKINEKYAALVIDKEVNAGNIATSWNPFSHNQYWTDSEVVEPLARSLVNTWKSINT
ncbi:MULTISPECIES: hypothetical protein [Trichocoleus]|uniref:Chemotaxis protein n=1 Tax=Trichocoleus desertorum GB2-A4 TaxID=2933944 RepID=A0ABV0JGR5_9CYAN|nr:hypothetical protein [Trichocoleus sp. FACHB-46]MBD1864549.1 hypothetical protein [Trichocoleus sp. FACHB-46]